MRKIKIENCQVQIGETKLLCPIQSGVNTIHCLTTCAWFRIEEHCRCEHEENVKSGDHSFLKYAYCGDKLIGEIRNGSNSNT